VRRGGTGGDLVSRLRAAARAYIVAVDVAGVAALAASFVFGGRPDLVPLLVAVAALVACAVPAWRAARVEPLTALRAE